MEDITAVLADGTELNFPSGTAPEVVQAAVKKYIANNAAPGPIMQHGGGWNASMEAHRPGIPEAFMDRGKEFVSGLAEIPGALVGMVNSTSPADPLGPVSRLAVSAYDSIKDSSARSAQRQGGGMRSMLGAVPVVGPYVMDKVSDIEEGNLQKVIGETGFDIASFMLPGKMAAKVAPAKSIAGGSSRIAMAEKLGIEPRRAAFGFRDRPAYQALAGAPVGTGKFWGGGDESTLLKNSIAEVNPELVSVGAEPLSDVLSMRQIKSAVNRSMAAAQEKATAAAAARRAAITAESKSVGEGAEQVAAARKAALLEEAATSRMTAEEVAKAKKDGLLGKVDVANAQGTNLRQLISRTSKDVDPLAPPPADPGLSSKFPAIDPADAADPILERMKAGNKAASQKLGADVGAARLPFADVPMPEEELARIAQKYSASPAVTSAIDKLLWSGPKGGGTPRQILPPEELARVKGKVPTILGPDGTAAGSTPPKLTFSDVNAIWDELQKAPSTDLAARGAARDLKAASIAQLQAQGLDTTALKAATDTFRAEVGIPFRKGQPGRSLALEAAQKPVAALNIPLTDARGWEAVVKSLNDASTYGGAPAAAAEMSALQRTMINNNMGLAKGMDTFTKNWQAASPRVKKVVFEEDAAEIDKVIDLLAHSRKQYDASQAWAKTRATVRADALEGVRENVLSMRGRLQAEAAAVKPDLKDAKRLKAEAGEVKADPSAANRLRAQASGVVTPKIAPTEKMTILDDVWNEYSPSKNITDPGLLPTSNVGIAALLARAQGRGRGSVRNFRIALEKTIKLGQPAALYNLVASTVREKKKENR